MLKGKIKMGKQRSLLMKLTPAWLLIFSLGTVMYLHGGTLSATDPVDLVPVDMLCENRVNPLGIDKKKPRLSWRFRANECELE